MAYVVTDACVRCKFTDCVAVCPVDCFHEGENMLVIDAEVCIDCGVCEPECPADAILADTDQRADKWLKMNKEYAAKWPVISARLPPPEDAETFKSLEGKFETHFSPAAAIR
jgi:ferredoxin